ncbi:YcxB family protein [Aliikangiella sp. IMCC44359]|uniref:YcxB family protein n=1 Tax=Aliikangiella sp. IMCC44359 TaxID=3459125 RepID=UPI00403B00DB
MELEIEYELSDWIEFQSHLEKTIFREPRRWWDSWWVNMIVWFLVAFVFFGFFQSDSNFSWETAGIVAFVLIFYFALMVLNGVKAKRACQPISGGAFLTKHKFVISDDGIKTKGAAYEANHKWDIVQRVEKTDRAIYLFIDSIHALIFPLSKVSSIESLEALIKKNVTKPS